MTHIHSCEFTTRRLHVDDWHRQADRHGLSLANVIQSTLTPAVTRFLPPHWQGEFTPGRIQTWIKARDEEGAMKLLVEIDTSMPVGFLTLFESADASPGPEIRLGYVVSEPCWGRGIATELVDGLVQWATPRGVRRIIGGIDTRNGGSQRVLEKCGFKPVATGVDTKPGEAWYEWYPNPAPVS